MGDFYQIFVMLPSIEILIETKFCFRMYVPYILKARLNTIESHMGATKAAP